MWKFFFSLFIFIFLNIYQNYSNSLSNIQYQFSLISTFLFICFFGILLPILTDQNVNITSSIFIASLYFLWFFTTYSLTNYVNKSSGTLVQVVQPIII